MPTRRPRLTFLLFVVGMLTVVGFAVFKLQFYPLKKASIKPGITVSSKTTIASPEYDYSAADYGKEINESQTYLINTFDKITPNRRLILDYLQRKYGLNKRFAAEYSPISPPAKNQSQHEDLMQFKAFERIAYPDRLVAVLPPAQGDTMTQMMLAAMQCDHIVLPANFGSLIQSNIDAGGYNLTHVEFSLQRMKENSCSILTPQKEKVILTELAARMAALVSVPATIPDLRYETIAFLLDMDRRDLVQPAWIEQIVTEQQSDGGWRAQGSKNSLDDDHATILALWAVLQYNRPAASYEPMIRHAN